MHAAHAGIRVLDVLDRIVIGLRTGKIDIEDSCESVLRATMNTRVASRADFVDQTRKVTSCRRAWTISLFVAAHHRDHLVQHVFGPAFGMPTSSACSPARTRFTVE